MAHTIKNQLGFSVCLLSYFVFVALQRRAQNQLNTSTCLHRKKVRGKIEGCLFTKFSMVEISL